MYYRCVYDYNCVYMYVCMAKEKRVVCILLFVDVLAIQSHYSARSHSAGSARALRGRRLADPSVPDLQSVVASHVLSSFVGACCMYVRMSFSTHWWICTGSCGRCCGPFRHHFLSLGTFIPQPCAHATGSSWGRPLGEWWWLMSG